METKTRGELHAALRKMPDGTYRAEFPGEFNPDHPDEREFPDFHLSTSMQSVKLWVEQMALGLGYSRVVWDRLPSN